VVTNLSTRPKLEAIESTYGMGIRLVVRQLFEQCSNLDSVAVAFGVSRVTLYKWLGKQEIAMIKAQAGIRRQMEDMPMN